MPRKNQRPVALLAIALTSAVLFTSGCSAAQNESVPETQLVRQAAIIDVAKSVVSGGYDAYKYLQTCLKNKALGQPCMASDGDNIRQTLQEVRELRNQMEANQQQVLAEFDAVRNMIRDQNIRAASDQLRSMVVNTEAADLAYEALSLCAVAETDECSPYIGEQGAPPEPIETAVEKTQDYFNQKAANLPQDILVTASWFSGTANRPQDGLAAAIWLYNKGIQDQQAGITDQAIKNSVTTPVVSAALANSTNQDLKYWTELYSKYAFYIVMYKGLTDSDNRAQSAQAEVNSRIADTQSRRSVLGAANAYAFPDMGETGMILFADNKAWIVEPGQSIIGGGRAALRADDLVQTSTIIADYAPVETFAAGVTSAMPADRWYTVKTPVNRVKYDWFQNYTYPKVKNYDAAWLVAEEKNGDASGVCPTKVRPVNKPIPRPGNVLNSTIQRSSLYGDRWIVQFEPAVTPDDRFLKTWEQFAKDRPIEYSWKIEYIQIEGKGTSKMGWGAWVNCTSDGYDSRIEMGYVPAGMGAAK